MKIFDWSNLQLGASFEKLSHHGIEGEKVTMSNWYFELVGKLTAETIGKFDSYSQEHNDFLSSGYVCLNCKESLMSGLGIPNIICLTKNDENVPLVFARLSGEKFQCPKCNHTWKLRAV